MNAVIPPAKATKEAREACWLLFKYAKRYGVLNPPSHCEKCPETDSLHGHHADYAKPLEVAWLCRDCHLAEHNRIGRVRQPASRKTIKLKDSPLTERQRDIYDFMVESVAKRGVPPTIREIGKKFGINSPNGVACHMTALISKGFVRRCDNISRGHTPIQKLVAVKS